MSEKCFHTRNYTIYKHEHECTTTVRKINQKGKTRKVRGKERWSENRAKETWMRECQSEKEETSTVFRKEWTMPTWTCFSLALRHCWCKIEKHQIECYGIYIYAKAHVCDSKLLSPVINTLRIRALNQLTAHGMTI